MIKRHKVFVSYHHANDQGYKEKFDRMFGEKFDILVNESVQDGDIDLNLKTETIRQKIRDEYLRDSTVTVVLIGKDTWKRKHVDWEIAASLRNTSFNPRSGLIGIILPSHSNYKKEDYDKYTMPPRLADNLDNGFAKIIDWTENPTALATQIDNAFQRRNQINPDNSRKMFGRNREDWRNRWTD